MHSEVENTPYTHAKYARTGRNYCTALNEIFQAHSLQ